MNTLLCHLLLVLQDKSGLSKGYGFVTFQNKKGYEAVLNQEVLSLNGQIVRYVYYSLQDIHTCLYASLR